MEKSENSAVYKPSKLGKVLAYISMLLLLCGIGGPLLKGAFDAVTVLSAAALILGGAGLYFLSRNLNYQSLTRYYEAQGVADRIRNDTGDMELCRKVYSANPSRYILNYITRLNPEAGAVLRQQIADKKRR